MSHASRYAGVADRRAAGQCPMSAEAVPLYTEATTDDRGAVWERLRARYGPVAPVEVAPGTVGWLLLGYHENLEALRDQNRFFAEPGLWDGPPRARALAGGGDEHRRLRAPIVDALARLTPARITAEVESVAGALLDGIATAGRADLIGQYAEPLSALLLNRLLGLPDDYGRLLADLTTAVWSGEHARAEPAARGVHDYFTGTVARKREHPGEDLATWLLRHPAALSDQEAAQELMSLWTAGHEPTTHLIGNALARLLGDPEIAMTYGSATLPADDFLDYVMWVDPPLKMLAGRFSAHDMRIGGAEIKKGEAMLVGFAPAHADPAVTGSGDARSFAGNRAHLMWGAGAHACPAQGLAREIARIALDTVVARLRGATLATVPDNLRWRDSLSVRGLVELPVVFAAARPAPDDTAAAEEKPVRGIGRRIRKTARPRRQGARYQAPSAPAEEDSPVRKEAPAAGVRPVPARPRRQSPSGARYQAPGSAAAEEPRPDALERLLGAWRAEPAP
ncbi:cytochrome P450 [Allosalinactinospora lopnorensis]|uniref:cytochrome P450 n=1 Tax=Allosalinactinospora lopnorensis TaxID=1352348 RepID=UPI00069616F5|nr:cytochrome P450 [Allosalinactinospora lopnorensis]